jgi:predicted transcriptional regulator
LRYYDSKKRDTPGDYFPLPKSIFRLDLSTGEIAVYAFLMYCEDRKTFQCHPSYATIGEATGMSKNTVKKYVESLERKGFIYTEPTKVKTKDGRTHNGSLLYTLRPIKPIEESYFEKKIAIANAQYQARLALEKFEKKHGRS